MWTKFRFLSLFTALSLTLTLSATTFEYKADGTQTQTIDGITVKLEKGGNATNAPAYSSYNGMKMYANNTITIDAEQAFKNVQLVFSKNDNKAYLTMTVSEGELVSGGVSTHKDSLKVDNWNGETKKLVFTMGASGQRLIHKIIVDGDPIEIDPIPTVVAIDTAEWDPTWLYYAEPTAIITPDTTFSKKEYIFVQTNIRVHCTQGAIIDTASTPYFNCHEGNQLSFEATQPIKGLVINGYVRRQFSASVDKGDIEYCSPGALEEDREGYPVVIISDINDTKVTISCDKQLRCYSVYVYFEANPNATLDCGGSSSGGEVFNLTFDTADAVYESEISADEGKTNYTIYLYNQATPDYPYLVLDLYPAAQGDLVGTYSMDDESLGETTWYQSGESQLDRVWMETDGQLAISKDGDIYSISGYLDCDDGNTYNFSFTGAMPFYTDTEYYDEGQGIETVPALNSNAPMFDLFGRKVNDTYRGVVIQGGHKYLLR